MPSDDEEDPVFSETELLEQQAARLSLNRRNQSAEPSRDSGRPSNRTGPPADAPVNELREYIKELQLKNEELRATNLELLEAIEELQGNQKKRRAKASLNVPDDQEALAKRIQWAAQYISVMVFPWCSPDDIRGDRPDIDVWDPYARFGDDESQENAHRQQVYDALVRFDAKDALRKRKEKWVGATFHGEANQHKSRFVATAKKIINLQYATVLRTLSTAERKTDDRCKYLRGHAKKLDVPCLFTSENVKASSEFLFVDVLAFIIKATLFGESSLRPSASSGPAIKPYGVIWNVKEITPGLLAFAIVALRFALSGEEQFLPPASKKSKRVDNAKNKEKDDSDDWDWPELHQQYVKLLLTAWRTRHIQAVVAWINGFTFGSLAIADKTSSVDDEEAMQIEAENNAFMAALARDDYTSNLDTHLTAPAAADSSTPIVAAAVVGSSAVDAPPAIVATRAAVIATPAAVFATSAAAAAPIVANPAAVSATSAAAPIVDAAPVAQPVVRRSTRRADEAARDPSPEAEEQAPHAPKTRGRGTGRRGNSRTKK